MLPVCTARYTTGACFRGILKQPWYAARLCCQVMLPVYAARVCCEGMLSWYTAGILCQSRLPRNAAGIH